MSRSFTVSLQRIALCVYG
uniref:Uncharacterized protein n=1 Tax=Rhizophora mucronata TaxID=61149 RepID=A0A2P2QG91_RHIMU